MCRAQNVLNKVWIVAGILLLSLTAAGCGKKPYQLSSPEDTTDPDYPRHYPQHIEDIEDIQE